MPNEGYRSRASRDLGFEQISRALEGRSADEQTIDTNDALAVGQVNA